MQRNTQRICTLFLVLSLCLVGLLPAATAQAQTSANWQIFYYPNTNWQGNPVYSQNAGTVAFNWGSDTPPGPGMPAQNWTARLVTTTFFVLVNVVADLLIGLLDPRVRANLN